MIRLAKTGDMERIEEIFAAARAFMRKCGNPTQWPESYPSRENIQSDIDAGACRVMYDESGVYAVFSLFPGEEPTYARVYEGAWPDDKPYGTIHRIASDGTRRGVLREAVRYCQALVNVIRADTHKNNLPMQRVLEKEGFRRCGIIHLDKAEDYERVAYQWEREWGK